MLYKEKQHAYTVTLYKFSYKCCVSFIECVKNIFSLKLQNIFHCFAKQKKTILILFSVSYFDYKSLTFLYIFSFITAIIPIIPKREICTKRRHKPLCSIIKILLREGSWGPDLSSF